MRKARKHKYVLINAHFFDINSTENKHKSRTSVFRDMLRDSLQHGGPCFGGKLFTADIVVGKLTKFNRLLHS